MNTTKLKIKICPICGNPAEINDISKGSRIECSLCGDFDIARPFPNLTEDEKIKLRYHYATLPSYDGRRIKEYITNENKTEFFKTLAESPSSLLGKIDLVLEHIYKNTNYFYENIDIWPKKDYRLFFCRESEELLNILRYLKEEDYIKLNLPISFSSPEIEIIDEACKVQIKPKGIKYIESLDKKVTSEQCFVSMYFSNKKINMEKIFTDIIKPAIDSTGYDSKKIDFNANIDYITDETIKEIRRSKFMIAELTDCSEKVYYEAGFAFGLGLPVIFTCNKNWEDQIPFDIKGQNIILWSEKSLKDFKKALSNRIGAVVGINENKKTDSYYALEGLPDKFWLTK